MKKIKNFLMRLRFNFYFDTYIFTVQTILLTQSYERLYFDVCRLRLEFFRKKIFEVDFYKIPRGFKY